MLEVVARDALILLQGFELLTGVATSTAQRDASLFGLSVHDLHKTLAAFFGERGKSEANDDAVIGRIEPEVGVTDRLFDRGHGALVKGRHDKEAWLGHREVGELL